MRDRTNRFHLAGTIYLGGATLVLLITLSTPGLVTPSRYAALAQLIFGVPFILLFGWLIYSGDHTVARLLQRRGWDEARARHWGERFQDGLTMILTLSSLGRLCVFAANSVGYAPEVHYIPFALHIHEIEPQPLFVLNALIMVVILWAMIRASWWPFAQRNAHLILRHKAAPQKPRIHVKRDWS